MKTVNTFNPSFYPSPDKAKNNQPGGLDNPNTLVEQGDYPIRYDDMQMHDQFRQEMAAEFPMGDEFVAHKRTGGDLEEGISMQKPLFNDPIRKMSDY